MTKFSASFWAVSSIFIFLAGCVRETGVIAPMVAPEAPQVGGATVEAPLEEHSFAIAGGSPWQAALSSRFDIAETFDDLQPWRGRCGGDFFGKATTPKLLDGSDSIWTYYSCWGTYASTGPSWIDNFGAGTQISGKSLYIDMGRTWKGPSRLGVYFGDGRADSGYDDLFLFYRVRFPANEWSTYINPDTHEGSYTPGAPWVYFYSWKFGTFNMGCTGMHAGNDCNGASPYSEMHIVPHIKRYGYGPMAGKLAIVKEPTGLTPYWALGKEIQTERWLGVEFHYRLAQQDGQKVVIMETWLYDPDGTAYLAQAPVAHPYASATAPAEKFNFFFLGGNNSNSYSWGPTMQSAYLVDDFIINGSRIGPTYFQLASQVLGGGSGGIVPTPTPTSTPTSTPTVTPTPTPTPSPSPTPTPIDTTPPVVTAFAVPATVTSATVPVTTFTATDNVRVTGFVITRSATAPLASASGWSATPPTSFLLPSSGTHTLFAWARDAAGRVSQSRSAVVTFQLADTRAPTIVAFTMPSSASSLTVPVTRFEATDDIGVTGYLLTENSTTPLVSSPGWSATPPASFRFAGTGIRYLRAWAKDASGKLSLRSSATVSITVPLPVVTAFSLPVTSSSLTVPIASFTGTGERITYLVKEDSATPSPSDSRWRSAPVTSYNFPAAGTRSLYAWVKDALNRVSASRRATVTITLPVPVIADRESLLKANFDIVDTFDNLQDFTGRAGGGDVHRDYPTRGANAMPVKVGGSPSIWNYYSMWAAAPTAQQWIAGHGSDRFGPNQLGTRSLLLDVFNRQGPSRLGSYFGNGAPNSGYQDIHVFYRVKIPATTWPTSNVNSGGSYTSSYTAGQPYAYFFSWKFFNVGTGFVNSALWDNPRGCQSGSQGLLTANPLAVDSTASCRYGDTENLVHLKSNNGIIIPDLEVWFSQYLRWGSRVKPFPTDRWAAVEMRYRLETPARTGNNGIMQMWIYEPDGTATQVLDLHDVNFRLAGNDNHFFNRIVLGGNNSNSFSLGAGMTSGYFVDDLVIDESRIGLRYFEVLRGAGLR